MKKFFKSILIIFVVLVIAVASLAIWQRKNIEGVVTGITNTTEEIERRRNDNQAQLVEDVSASMDVPVREITEEEKKEIESGQTTLPDVYSKIFAEKEAEIVQTKHEETASPTKDEIISKYMSELYNLQSEFTARAEATIKQGDRYYETLKKTQDKAVARANTIAHFTPIVRSIESDCNARVEKVIENLTNELIAIGENTDIVRTIRNTYANEKQLKLSYYANKYLK